MLGKLTLPEIGELPELLPEPETRLGTSEMEIHEDVYPSIDASGVPVAGTSNSYNSVLTPIYENEYDTKPIDFKKSTTLPIMSVESQPSIDEKLLKTFGTKLRDLEEVVSNNEPNNEP